MTILIKGQPLHSVKIYSTGSFTDAQDAAICDALYGNLSTRSLLELSCEIDAAEATSQCLSDEVNIAFAYSHDGETWFDAKAEELSEE